MAFEGLRSYLFKMPRQHSVSPLRYGGKILPEAVLFSVMGYFFLFFVTFAFATLALSIIGLDPITAWSGAGSSLANVGPGLGDVIGPSGSYQTLPNSAKWVFNDDNDCWALGNCYSPVVLTPKFLAELDFRQGKAISIITKLTISIYNSQIQPYPSRRFLLNDCNVLSNLSREHLHLASTAAVSTTRTPLS